MGEEVMIERLARQVIESSGYTVRDDNNPDGDIEIVFTGLRPGEKIFEELTLSQERLTTLHPKIFATREQALSEIEVASVLRSLREAISAGDKVAAIAVLDRWIEGRRTQGSSAVHGSN
jgi:FlaA1/EpsC-like NDP-sugar epimerase